MNWPMPLDDYSEDKDKAKRIHFDTMFFINCICELSRLDDQFPRAYSSENAIMKFNNK
jgi:hypothetical protein